MIPSMSAIQRIGLTHFMSPAISPRARRAGTCAQTPGLVNTDVAQKVDPKWSAVVDISNRGRGYITTLKLWVYVREVKTPGFFA